MSQAAQILQQIKLERNSQSLRLSHHVNERLQREYVKALFEETKYGLKLLRPDNSIYTIVLKNHDRHTIGYWLYDYSQKQQVENYYAPLTASEAKAKMINDGLTGTPLYRECLVSISKMHEYYSNKFNWTNVKGLGCISKSHLWLYANNLTKLDVVMNDGYINQHVRHLNKWNGIVFEKSDEFDPHNFPKSHILGANGVVYPINYAKKFNVKVVLSTTNESENDNSENVNLVFSHKLGYYDGNKYTVYRGRLFNASDVVDTINGRKYPKVECVFIQRHDGYLHRDYCVETSEGVFERENECYQFTVRGERKYVHRLDAQVVHCGMCGNGNHIESMHVIDEEHSVCDNCADSMDDSLGRMCYSTDVLDKKGFGTTGLKINNKPVYVGLELECFADYNSNSMEEVLKGLNMFAVSKQNYTIPTRDGSLDHNRGVEYIFRPEGLIQQKRNVVDFVSKTGKYLAGDAGNGYGLHIHVSAHFLTHMDKVKIDNFVSTFEKYFRHFGARAETEYQHKKKIDSNSKLNFFDDRKYKMVNIGKPETVEYRFPKSLVDEVHINMNLELALATTMFCKYHLSNVDLNANVCSDKALKAFIKFIADNKKQYPLVNAENNANIKLNNLTRYSIHYSKTVVPTEVKVVNGRTRFRVGENEPVEIHINNVADVSRPLFDRMYTSIDWFSDMNEIADYSPHPYLGRTRNDRSVVRSHERTVSDVVQANRERMQEMAENSQRTPVGRLIGEWFR